MRRHFLMIAFALYALAIPAFGQAQTAGSGTAEEARAMLDRVVAGMKADPTKTIAQIKKGEGGFKDRDLYASVLGPRGGPWLIPIRRGSACCNERTRTSTASRMARSSRGSRKKAKLPRSTICTRGQDRIRPRFTKSRS